MGNHDDWVPLSKVLRPIVLERDGHLCQIAGPQCEGPGEPLPPSELEVDHIVPLFQGGALADLDNLQAVCRLCHERKTTVELGYRRRSRTRTKTPRPGWRWEGLTAG